MWALIPNGSGYLAISSEYGDRGRHGLCPMGHCIVESLLMKTLSHRAVQKKKFLLSRPESLHLSCIIKNSPRILPPVGSRISLRGRGSCLARYGRHTGPDWPRGVMWLDWSTGLLRVRPLRRLLWRWRATSPAPMKGLSKETASASVLRSLLRLRTVR